MKANKTITNMIKLIATNQKQTFILKYGVLRTVAVVLGLTTVYSLVGQSIPPSQLPKTVLIKLALSIALGHVTGEIEWRMYSKIINFISEKKVYQPWFLLHGVVGFGLLCSLALIGSLKGLLMIQLWRSIVTVIVFSLTGLAFGYFQYHATDVHMIRRIAAKYKK